MKLSKPIKTVAFAAVYGTFAFVIFHSVFLAIVWAGAAAAIHLVLVGAARKRSKKQPRVKRDLVLSLFDGAIGSNFYVRPRIDRREDGTIEIKTGQIDMAEENSEALCRFARLHVTGPAVTDDDVTGMGWYNVQRGLGQALAGYFDQVTGPPGFAPFAAYALQNPDGSICAYINVRNIQNGDSEALKVLIDAAMCQIDELYQSGKVILVKDGLL